MGGSEPSTGSLFALQRGRRLGIVGESGSGKTVAGLAIMGLHRSNAARVMGEIRLDGQELVGADPEVVRRLRGNRMAMIFQDPLSAMHPYYSVGHQIVEAYRVHHRVNKRAARKRAVELLDRVGILRAASRVDDYPHHFSGGITPAGADRDGPVLQSGAAHRREPTTALDVTVQAQILDLIRDLQAEFESAVIITHDLGVVAELADDILVMYAGRAVEYATAADMFAAWRHPYTWGLLGSVARWDRPRTTRLRPIPGNPPSLVRVPPGCPFHPRCGYAARTGGRCEDTRPQMSGVAGTDDRHLVACHLAEDNRQRIFADEIRPAL